MNRAVRLSRIAKLFWQVNSPIAQQVDLQGKCFLITGGSSGMGAEISQTLASWGAHTIITCRSSKKGDQIVEKILSHDSGAHVTLFSEADTSDLNSMRSLAHKVISHDEIEQLDGLILNAGVLQKQHAESKQGYELNVATNTLGHHLLVRRLLPLLTKAELGKVIYVVGDIYKFADNCTLDFSYKSKTIQAYARSKLGVLWNAFTLHERKEQLGSPNVASIGVHPGVVATNIISGPMWLKRLLLISANRGAQTTLRAATDSSIISGQHVHNTLGVMDFHKLGPVVNSQRRLEFWEECEQAISQYLT